MTGLRPGVKKVWLAGHSSRSLARQPSSWLVALLLDFPNRNHQERSEEFLERLLRTLDSVVPEDEGYDLVVAGGFVFIPEPTCSCGTRFLPAGVHVKVEKGEDQEQLRQLADRLAGPDPSLWDKRCLGFELGDHPEMAADLLHPDTPIVVIEAGLWKIITAENAVAIFQGLKANVLGLVDSAVDAMLVLQALETGLDGVILRTDRDNEVLQLQAMLAHGPHAPPAATDDQSGSGATRSSAATPSEQESPRVDLCWATLTRVEASGMGHRACVDLCTLLPPGSGMLVGSFSRGLFLVHSECLANDFVASRPFRVNAGPVCSYVAVPGGKTAYLSELKAGSEVVVVDAETGATSVATVGRVKVEVRPMMLLEAEVAAQGSSAAFRLSIFVQNAETVRLMTDAGSNLWGMSSSRGPSGSIGSESVSQLKVGDKVLVSVLQGEGVARHTGIAVKEFILEQ